MARVYGISSTGVEYDPNAPCNEQIGRAHV